VTKKIFKSPAIADSVLNKSNSQWLFEDSNNLMKTLLLLCRGLKDDNGNTAFVLESNPWKSTLLKKQVYSWKPNSNALKSYHLAMGDFL
jgi:hypothetical protein